MSGDDSPQIHHDAEGGTDLPVKDYGIIEGQDKDGSGRCVNTISPEPNHREGVAKLSVPTMQGHGLQDLALTFLQVAAEDYEGYRDRRDYYAAAAHRAGITYQRIADIYGVTEGAVRAMVKRNGGE